MTYIHSRAHTPNHIKKATDLAFLVCKNCNVIWATAEPGQIKYGIVLEARKEYTTANCSNCNNGTASYKLEKIESFIKCLNFYALKLGSYLSEVTHSINIRIHQFDECLQRLRPEMVLQVCPSTT